MSKLYERLSRISHEISFGLTNGHVISGELKELVETDSSPFFLVISKIFGLCFIAEDEIAYVSVKDISNIRNPAYMRNNIKPINAELRDNIAIAKQKYRQTDFTSKHPTSDGLEGRFKPRIEK